MRFGRKSISVSIIALLIIMIAGFNVAFYLLYQKSIDSLDASLGERLLSIARTAAPELSPTLRSELADGELSLTSLVHIHDYFSELQRGDQLSGVYLLGNKMENLLGDDDSYSSFDALLPLHLENIARAQLGEANVSELYRVEDRYFKSAYYPLGGDSVIAVMVVESDFDFFQDLSAFKRHILLVNGIAALALLIVAGIILLLNRQLIRAEKMIISQAALSQMGQMAAMIAHEVRNPLAIIKATAERLKKKYGGNDQAEQQLFDYIPEEVDRLHQITSHYLQFAAPESLKGKEESVKAIADSVCEGLNKEFQGKGVSLQREIGGEINELKIDSVQFRQILMNLLRNALEATPEKGSVRLSVKEEVGERINLIVSDTGCGLPKSDLKRLFDPFFTTKSSGTGLGLFVVKRLVDNLKGSIIAELEVSSGTKFTVTLPVRKNG